MWNVIYLGKCKHEFNQIDFFLHGFLRFVNAKLFKLSKSWKFPFETIFIDIQPKCEKSVLPNDRTQLNDNLKITGDSIKK